MAKKTTRRTKKSHPNDRPHGPDGRFQKQSTLGEARVVTTGGVASAFVEDVENAEAVVEAEATIELGRTGLRHYAGTIDEEFLPALRGLRANKVYQEMRDNDPTIGAMFFAVEMLMRQVRWTVEPGTDDPSDVELADFVQSCLDDMTDTWEDTLASIFSFISFGFSIHEEVYKHRDGFHPDDPTRDSNFNDGRIGWRKLPVRAQDTVQRWVFNPATDEVDGVVQMPPPDFGLRVIPSSKYLLFRTTSVKSNPQGRSMLRNAYRPWYFKRRIEEIEGVGIERDLAGLPSMGVPAEILDVNAKPEKQAQLQSIRKMLRDVRRDEREGVVWPLAYDKEGRPMYSFELVRSGGRRQFDTTAIVNRYDRLIASVALADFILLGQQRVGSFALAESKTELFGVALGAWLNQVTATFNRVAIPRLLLMNGIQRDKPPKLVHGDVEVVDLKEIGEFVAKLSGAGMPLFPDDEVENALRSAAGWPEKVEEEGDEGGQPQLDEETLARLAEAEAAAGGSGGAPSDATIGVFENVQAQVLNGAQIAAIVTVAQEAKGGGLSRESAIAILGVAFGFDEQQSEDILGPIEEAKPEPAAAPEPFRANQDAPLPPELRARAGGPQDGEPEPEA